MTKIAAIQMCSSHIVEDNLDTAAGLIRTAAQNGAKLVVLPEMFPIVALNANDKVLVGEDVGSGRIQAFLAEQARQYGIWIVGGTIPLKSAQEDKIRAASLLYDAKGEVVARYDKIHLFDVTISTSEEYKESAVTEPGNTIVVVDTPFGKLGMAVCYDVRFPELFRCMFNAGAEIFVLPSAFTVPTGQAHWELLARSRAVESFCYVIGACQGATHSGGRKTYGHSLIVEPWGNIAAKLDGVEPGVIYADIDLNKVYDARKSIAIKEHQRIFFNLDNLLLA